MLWPISCFSSNLLRFILLKVMSLILFCEIACREASHEAKSSSLQQSIPLDPETKEYPSFLKNFVPKQQT
jgi:hypothetical protein